MDFTHCLRPAFTKGILKKLDMGINVNVYHLYTEELQRFTNDIRKCIHQKENVICLYLQLKLSVYSYNDFVKELGRGLNIINTTDDLLIDKVYHEINGNNRKVYLVIEGLDEGFEKQSIDLINNLKLFNTLRNLGSLGNVALLCVTSSPANHRTIYWEERNGNNKILKNITSPLVFDTPDEIRPMWESEIKAELNREKSLLLERLLSNNLYWEDFLSLIKKEKNGYIYLKIASKIQVDNNSSFQWKDYKKIIVKEWKKQKRRDIDYHMIKAENWLKKRFFWIKKAIPELKSVRGFKRWIGAVIGLVGTIAYFWDKIISLF